jgi:hypothetical protein
MAIKSVYDNQQRVILGSVGSATGSTQPDAFRAQGKGWFNKLPNYFAHAGNANASMTNKATAQSSKSYKIYLFINSIATGWAVAGEYGQGPMGRVWYPRNLTQDEIAIEGIVANQYEYDRIVQFVEFHHRTQMLPQIEVPPNLNGDSTYPGVDFRLFKPQGGHPLDAFKPLAYLGVVTDVQGGHERFKNFLTYSLTFKVTYDFLGVHEEIDQQMNKLITRQDVFGQASNPVLTTNNSPLQKPVSTTTKAANAAAVGGSDASPNNTIGGPQ